MPDGIPDEIAARFAREDTTPQSLAEFVCSAGELAAAVLGDRYGECVRGEQP